MKQARGKIMNCANVQEHLSEYLDGKLDIGTSAFIKDHLENCQECSQELVSLKKYLKTVRSIPQDKPAPGFLKRVHERIENQKRLRGVIANIFTPRRWFIPIGAVGVLASALLVVLFMLPHPFQKPSLDKTASTEFMKADVRMKKSVQRSSNPGGLDHDYMGSIMNNGGKSFNPHLRIWMVGNRNNQTESPVFISMLFPKKNLRRFWSLRHPRKKRLMIPRRRTRKRLPRTQSLKRKRARDQAAPTARFQLIIFTVSQIYTRILNVNI